MRDLRTNDPSSKSMLSELSDSSRSHEKICSYKIVDIVILQISTHLKTTLSMTRIRSCVALKK